MLEPLKIRNFRMLFTAQVFSDFGGWLEFAALTVLIVYRWELGGAAMAAWFICLCLPYVLFGSFLGVWADMVDRRKVMIASDLARMLLLIAMVWVPNLYVLLVIVFIKGTLTTLFNSARQGTIRLLVPESHLMQANSLSQTSINLSKFIGPTLSGILLGVLNMDQVFLFCAFFFLCSALFLMRMPSLRIPEEQRKAQQSYRDELKFGLQYISTNKALLAATAFFTIECLAMFAFEPQISPMVIFAGFGEGKYTNFVSVVGLGSIIGAYLLGKWGERFHPYSLLLFGTLVLGTALLWIASGGFGVAPVTFALWLVAFLFVGLGIGALGVCYGYLLQTATPPEYMGRVAGTFEAVVYMGILAGTLIGGFISEGIGPQMVFAYAGVFFLLLGVGFRVVTHLLGIGPKPSRGNQGVQV